MRRLALTLVALLAAVAVATCAATKPPAPKTPDGEELLPVGDVAPDFIATGHDGTPIHLIDLRGRPVVLYFYPMDDTTGCTKEACSFRDAWGRLQSEGVAVYGVSTQDPVSHTAYALKFHLPFPLIPDDRGELAAKYHVPVIDGRARRVTYLIDEEGRIAHVWPRVEVERHAEEVLRAVAAARAAADGGAEDTRAPI
jgi:peroxiredoxin Q/BCP